MSNQDPSTAIINAETGETLVPLAPLPPQLEESKALKIQSCFVGVAAEAQALVDMYPEFINKEITQELVELATEYKKRVTKTRNSITKIRKSEKEFYLRGGQFVDAIGKKLITPLEEIEGNLEPIINHFELLEAKRRADLRDKRWAELSQFTERYPERLDVMEEEDYQTLLAGAKAIRAQEIEAARLEKERIERERIAFEEEQRKLREQAEADRIARQKAEDEARKLRLEQEKQRKEAEAKQREIDRIAAELEAEKRRAEQEKARLEAERLKAIEDAKRAEAERLAAEQAEADRIAALPIQEATRAWINSFEVPAAPVQSPAVDVIKQKFEAFKTWALTQV